MLYIVLDMSALLYALVAIQKWAGIWLRLHVKAGFPKRRHLGTTVIQSASYPNTETK